MGLQGEQAQMENSAWSSNLIERYRKLLTSPHTWFKSLTCVYIYIYTALLLLTAGSQSSASQVQKGCASLQFCPCLGGCRGVLGHELGDFADEVGLFGAAFAGLAPFLQDLLQVFHLELLQVHCGQVQLFVCKRGNRVRTRLQIPFCPWNINIVSTQSAECQSLLFVFEYLSKGKVLTGQKCTGSVKQLLAAEICFNSLFLFHLFIQQLLTQSQKWPQTWLHASCTE